MSSGHITDILLSLKQLSLGLAPAFFSKDTHVIHVTPWEMVFRVKKRRPQGQEETSCQIFKDAYHTAQELSVPRCKKSGKQGKRPAWLSQDMLVKLNSKRGLHRTVEAGTGIVRRA